MESGPRTPLTRPCQTENPFLPRNKWEKLPQRRIPSSRGNSLCAIKKDRNTLCASRKVQRSSGRCDNCEASYREVTMESLISSTTASTWRDQDDILVSQTSIRPRWKQIQQIFNLFLFNNFAFSWNIFFSRLMVHELLYFRVIIVVALIYSYVHFF